LLETLPPYDSEKSQRGYFAVEGYVFVVNSFQKARRSFATSWLVVAYRLELST